LIKSASLDGERVRALEDCSHVSGALERSSIAHGAVQRIRELTHTIKAHEPEIAGLVAQLARSRRHRQARG
jgi:hypothetical protein